MSLFLDAPSEIVESGSTYGGHAGSFFDQGYTFDYGPHIMFSRNKEILQFMIDSLGENVNQLKRNNKISYKNKLIRYPFENDLSSLPIEDNYDCVHGYLFNPYKEQYKDPQNLEQWLLKTFGKGICEKYLFPYNEKVWNVPVKDLSMLWAERIPNPPAEDILKSAIGFKTEGYLHQLYYHYPKTGGYASISEAWTKLVKSPITYNYVVNSVERLADGRWRISDGKEPKEFDELISTMPIQEVVKLINIEIPTEVQAAIDGLIVNPMIIVSLGITGVDQDLITATYFPEADFWVNRISYPATFSPQNAPEGHYSVQAEITCRNDSETWKMTDEEVTKHVIDGLDQRGIINQDNVSYVNVHRSQYSYVVYDTHYEKNVKIIREWFPKQGIHLVGRFSYFEYINVDGAVATAQKIAEAINGKPVVFKDILKKA